MTQGNSSKTPTPTMDQEQPAEQIQEFRVLRPAGFKPVILQNGAEGIQFFFSVHLDDEERSQLTADINGQRVPIILQSVPIQTGPEPTKIIQPNSNGRIFH